jgi:hypothetical protein
VRDVLVAGGAVVDVVLHRGPYALLVHGTSMAPRWPLDGPSMAPR